LKPVHDSIAELRKQNVAYAAIAELLEQHGVKTSRRVWPNTAASSWRAANRASDGSGRKPRQPQISRPRLKVRSRGRKTRTSHAAGNSDHERFPAAPNETSPYRSRGPHIANVRMMSAEEAKEFNDSLKPKPPAS